MKLSALLREVAVSGDLGNDPEVFGVRHDSRAVEPGELFVTWSGAKFDGRLFAGQAIERGAVAVLADRPRPADTAPEIPWLEAADPRALLGDLAAPLYGYPASALALVGVTGTNGKSTVVELCANMLDAAWAPRRQDRNARLPLRRLRSRGRCRIRTVRAHHARGVGSLPTARHHARPRSPCGGHGGLVARSGPGPGPGGAVRPGPVHQSDSRPSRLPRRPRSLLRRQAAPVRPAQARWPRGGES